MSTIICTECGKVKIQNNKGVTICPDCIRVIPEDRIKLLAIRQFTRANPGVSAIEIGKRLGISVSDINRLITAGSLQLIEGENGAEVQVPEENEKKQRYDRKTISELAKAFNEDERKQKRYSEYKLNIDRRNKEIQAELQRRRKLRDDNGEER